MVEQNDVQRVLAAIARVGLTYHCAACGAQTVGDPATRGCGHAAAPVLAEMAAGLTGAGQVSAA